MGWFGAAAAAAAGPAAAVAAIDVRELQKVARVEGESPEQKLQRELQAIKDEPLRRVDYVDGKIIDGKVPEIARAPELKDFVCLYEVALGLAELEDLATNPEMWPVLRERLEVIFANGIFSMQNVYGGAALAYNDQIKYARTVTKDEASFDKQVRSACVVNTFNALNDVLKTLRSPAGQNVDVSKIVVVTGVHRAHADMDAFVGLATPAEVESAKQFLAMLPKAAGGKSFLSLEELRAFDEVKMKASFEAVNEEFGRAYIDWRSVRDAIPMF